MEYGTKTTGGRSRLGKLVLLAASIALGLGMAEVISRLFEPSRKLVTEVVSDRKRQDAALFMPASPPLMYVPVPGRSAGPGRMNNLGMRDRDYDPKKPAGVKRILMLGDSIVWGSGIDQDLTFENQLEEMLKKSGARVQILNMGVPGYNAVMMAAYLRERGLALKPDYVLALVGLNDQTATPVVLWDRKQARFRFYDGGFRDRIPWIFRLPLGMGRWLMINSAIFRTLCRLAYSPGQRM
ncbi:MAG: SGNH/GDSL hydrolase family protein, partial [Deltaproteobacteria bacterium]|nr:SGNH/GDSL hydrolase family protein [Deltaproteobacteria bacterium]